MIDLLQRALIKLAERSSNDFLLGLAEGHFKVAVANALLELGCELQEGSYASRQERGIKTPLADFVQLVDGVVRWRRGDRQLALDDGSTDITIVWPIRLQLELKTRPDHGTKSQAQSQELVADIDRVRTTPGVAFLFVFDEKIYRSFSGMKTEARGAPSEFAGELAMLFPAIGGLSPNIPTILTKDWRGQSLCLICYRQELESGIHRVLVAGLIAAQSGGVNQP